MSEPTFWYKILDEAPPSPLPETLPATPLDAQDGFIHLSTASQIPITAGLFFSTHEKIWVLKLRRDKIDGRVDYPPELGKSCPHIHESRTGLGKHNIENVIELKRAEGQKWGDVKEMGELEG
jgi:uncharacterized protein (DUF952 family)